MTAAPKKSGKPGKQSAGSPRQTFARPPRQATAPREAGEKLDPQRKVIWRPGTLLAPVPPVLVSCGGNSTYRANLITVAWAGIINSEPPMLSISLRAERYSHEIISATREFVVNLPSASLARVVDFCGMKSGRNIDKFAETRLTAGRCDAVNAPLVCECPVSLACKVSQIIPLGSHDMFLATIVAVHVRETLIDRKGKLRLDKADLLAYAHGEYYILGKRLGAFGFSVRK